MGTRFKIAPLFLKCAQGRKQKDDKGKQPVVNKAGPLMMRVFLQLPASMTTPTFTDGSEEWFIPGNQVSETPVEVRPRPVLSKVVLDDIAVI